MPLENIPTDVLHRDLIDTYEAARRRLELLIQTSLRRGLSGEGTLLYRRQQYAQAVAILRSLNAQLAAHARGPVTAAYAATVRAVDATMGDALTLRAGFGTVHTRAVEVLAGNMQRSLAAAIEQVGGNINDVFARADAIEGALRHDQPSPGPIPFIGRRLDDPYRKLALSTVAEGTVTLETRREVSAQLERRLVTEGVTDAVAGFVDRTGRRWPLDVYARMVVRTTTREATNRATVNRLAEGGLGIVTVSSHQHPADECDPYDGQTFALNAATAAREGLPRLTVMPPFHPNCKHVLTPGQGNLDAFERELASAVGRA